MRRNPLSSQDLASLHRRAMLAVQQRWVRADTFASTAAGQATETACLIRMAKVTNLDAATAGTKAILTVRKSDSSGQQVGLLGAITGAGNQTDIAYYTGTYCPNGIYLTTAGTTATLFGLTCEYVPVESIAMFLDEDPVELNRALGSTTTLNSIHRGDSGSGRPVDPLGARPGIGAGGLS